MSSIAKRTAFITLLAALPGWLISMPGCRSADRAVLDQAALEEVEDLSESLANSLLEFSLAVRDRNVDRIAGHFSQRIEVRPLELPDAVTGGHAWISSGSSDMSGIEPRPLGRIAVINGWLSFLDRFSSIEDARFKVKAAEFSRSANEVSGSGLIRFFLIGRDTSGKRLAAKGAGRLQARRREEAWLMTSLVIDDIEISRAERDLFSEVGMPAGLSATLPPFGSGRADFAYHGAAAGDVDGDGLLDLLVTGSSRNYLYLNSGDGTFEETAEGALLELTPTAIAPLFLDYDNDGDLDVFMTAIGEQMLFENVEGPGNQLTFLDASGSAGVALPAVGFSAAAGDVDGDGWPDIYVTSYNHYGQVLPNSWHNASNGTPNLLFVNQKDGTFREEGAAWGVRDTRWSYAAVLADLDGDGDQDLYLANDFGENGLYINVGGRFEDRAASMGTLDPGNGMGVSLGDYNNDGVLDIHVTNMSSTAGRRILNRLFPESGPQADVLRKLSSGNTLFQGRSGGSFRDVTSEVGSLSAGWAWGGGFVDFDNDGWQDLYAPNGFISGKTMNDT